MTRYDRTFSTSCLLLKLKKEQTNKSTVLECKINHYCNGMRKCKNGLDGDDLIDLKTKSVY